MQMEFYCYNHNCKITSLLYYQEDSRLPSEICRLPFFCLHLPFVATRLPSAKHKISNSSPNFRLASPASHQQTIKRETSESGRQTEMENSLPFCACPQPSPISHGRWLMKGGRRKPASHLTFVISCLPPEANDKMWNRRRQETNDTREMDDGLPPEANDRIWDSRLQTPTGQRQMGDGRLTVVCRLSSAVSQCLFVAFHWHTTKRKPPDYK